MVPTRRGVPVARQIFAHQIQQRHQAQLQQIPTSVRHLGADLVQTAFAPVYDWLEPAIMRDKIRRLPQGWRVHAHG